MIKGMGRHCPGAKAFGPGKTRDFPSDMQPGCFQITPFDGMVLKIVLGFDKASAGCGFVTTYESLDLDLSYYNSLRVFNLLQNEDLELYPKR